MGGEKRGHKQRALNVLVLLPSWDAPTGSSLDWCWGNSFNVGRIKGRNTGVFIWIHRGVYMDCAIFSHFNESRKLCKEMFFDLWKLTRHDDKH